RREAGQGVHAVREAPGAGRQIMPRRIPPSIWIGVGAGLLFCSSLFLVFFVSMKKDSNEELCRANLTIIGMAIRGGELPSSPKWDAAASSSPARSAGPPTRSASSTPAAP